MRGIIFATVTIAIFLIPSLPQNENYHHFADPRAFGGIHSAFDVLSNVFFLIVDLLGMRFALNDRSAAHPV